jgi:hypothetical protein
MSLDRYLQRGKVNGARKGLFTLSAQQETSLGARGENLVEAAEEGRNYLLQLRLQHLLQLGMRISLGKTRK